MEFFVFILGIFIGSFLNVIIDRSARNESFFGGRSYCEKCHKNLAWHDLIPLLSFIYLQGKCKYCNSPIGYWYPLIEITTGLLFVATFLFVSQSAVQSSYMFVMALLVYFFITSSLIIIFYIDLKYGIIPDKVVFPTTLITFLYLLSTSPNVFPAHVFSAVGACIFFFLLFLGTKGKGMGFGDVKYSFMMGLILGFPNIIIGLYTAFLSGAIISLILVSIGKKKLKGSTIPFGPFLVFGTILALFCGREILDIVMIYFF